MFWLIQFLRDGRATSVNKHETSKKEGSLRQGQIRQATEGCSVCALGAALLSLSLSVSLSPLRYPLTFLSRSYQRDSPIGSFLASVLRA